MIAPMARRAVRASLQKAISGSRIGMGMARPQSTAGSVQHRPPTSSPRTVTDGCEWVRQRQKPCPHRTRGHDARSRPHVAFGSCGKVPPGCRKASEAMAMDRQPDPDPAKAANPKERESVSHGPKTDDRSAPRPDDGRSAPA